MDRWKYFQLNRVAFQEPLQKERKKERKKAKQTLTQPLHGDKRV